MGCCDPAARTIDPARYLACQAEFGQLGNVWQCGYGWITAKVTASSTPLAMIKTAARGQAMINLARIAIALERHRLATGKLAERLEDIPAALRPAGGWPIDPASRTSQYRLLPGDRAQLYYMGWNGTDDGADFAGIDSKDYVWPPPPPP